MSIRVNKRRQDPRDFKGKSLNTRGYRHLMRLVRQNDGNIQAAARAMGMSGHTAWRYATGRATVQR